MFIFRNLIMPALVSAAMTSAAHSQASAPETRESETVSDDLKQLRAEVENLSHRLDDQNHLVAAQQRIIDTLVQRLNGRVDGAVEQGMVSGSEAHEPRAQLPQLQLDSMRAAGVSPKTIESGNPAQSGPTVAQNNPATASPEPASQLPSQPVGEANGTTNSAAEITALPDEVRVLTPKGSLIAESSIEYDSTSSNRLVFSGVEIVPGLQLGLVDANDVARDTVIGTADFRYGLFDRVEVEVRVPFFYRHDRLTVLSQQLSSTVPANTQTTNLEGLDIGDVEFAARYQLNRTTENGAIYVAGLRVKSATGLGPYDVRFNSDGIAEDLGTGSGFWAAGPNLTMLLPTDPAVIFVNIGYLHSFGGNINKNIGTTHIGDVEPGDSVDLSMGFGFSVNPQFSFSLGFSNTFIFPTATELNTTKLRSNNLEAGSFTMGWSYVFSPRFAVSTNFEFGLTADAPDMRALVRMPFRF